MYRCNECGRMFDEPNYMEMSWEDYDGISGVFNGPEHYAIFAECPGCGEPIDVEYDIYDEEEDYEDDIEDLE